MDTVWPTEVRFTRKVAAFYLRSPVHSYQVVRRSELAAAGGPGRCDRRRAAVVTAHRPPRSSRRAASTSCHPAPHSGVSTAAAGTGCSPGPGCSALRDPGNSMGIGSATVASLDPRRAPTTSLAVCPVTLAREYSETITRSASGCSPRARYSDLRLDNRVQRQGAPHRGRRRAAQGRAKRARPQRPTYACPRHPNRRDCHRVRHSWAGGANAAATRAPDVTGWRDPRKNPHPHLEGAYADFCAPGRNRTCDTRFRKPMLYPLSYEGLRPTSYRPGDTHECRGVPSDAHWCHPVGR
jgi:hypothetical protein